MDFIKEPMKIEEKSMEIIAPCLDGLNLSEEEKKVYSRMIHASGDTDYANHIRMDERAVAAGKEALLAGANVYTDVEMVRAGINKKILGELGGEVRCLIADEEVAKIAKKEGITRSMAAMRKLGKKLATSIVCIGNAPTALFEVLRLAEEENICPALIIGIPVGFVGAADAKEHLTKNGKMPYITVLGTKGGSTVCVSALNALMYLLKDRT